MPDFRLYNTLTRRVESFAPADGQTVRLYSCGPTVYNPAHIGNFRTFLFVDLLRRVLRLRGWALDHVMNVTDVDDKIIKRASEQRRTIREITEPVTETFFRDRDYLRIEPAERYPKATDHIPDMIALVQKLIVRGIAYQAEDGSVYFAIARFGDYGKLSRLDTRSIRAGARVAADDYNKEDVRDFALWKSAKPEDELTGAAWDSPWGRGRPGWHLECSAMAMRYLGETLDIHCGGVDLIFPHHEDEIAQSEGATGVPFARLWCHGEFLLTDGAKMAKRVGNVSTVADLRENGISAAAMRHFVFSTHYRKQLNLTADAMEGSMNAVRRIADFADRLDRCLAGPSSLAEAADELERDALTALFDDLNAPLALGALFVFINRVNADLDRFEAAPRGEASSAGVGGNGVARARSAFAVVNGVLDVVPERGVGTDDSELVRWVANRIAERAQARVTRDFATADRIRDELLARDIVLEDTPAGARWKKVK
ncbi:MAG: cysteine--tRNA ligase [Gemmatimonadaceae bacterium]